MMVDTVDKLESLNLIHHGDTIADIGCGLSAWGQTMVKKGYIFHYIGLDVSKWRLDNSESSLNLTKRRYPFFSYELHLMDCASNCYNKMGKLDPAKIVFPIEDKSVDLVICHSLFTHLGTESVASHYVDEIKRILKPKGKLWITFFVSPPNEVCDEIQRTVYPEAFVFNLLKDFTILYQSGGSTKDYNDQLEIACEYIHP